MKKRFIAIIAILVLVIAVSVSFVACGGTQLQGMDIDLAKAVAEELGLEVKFQPISWDIKETELSSGTIDMIWNGLTITDERKAQMSISEPYMFNNQVCIISKDSKDKFTTKESMATARFTAEKGSAGVTVIAEQFAGAKFFAADSQILAMMEIMSGTSDIAVIDSTMAYYYCSTGDYAKKLMVVPNMELSIEKYGIALRKADLGTLDKLNTVLAKFSADGTTKKIADKYNLGDKVAPIEYTSKFDTLTAEEKAGWDKLVKKGKFIIGYTVYAPIAF